MEELKSSRGSSRLRQAPLLPNWCFPAWLVMVLGGMGKSFKKIQIVMRYFILL